MIKKIFLLVLLTVSLMNLNAQITAVALVGQAAGGWPGMAGNPGPIDVHQMTSTDGENWTLNAVTLTTSTTTGDGGVKFRDNNNWSINWGSPSFPNGIGTQDGANIMVQAGTYNLTFNSLTGEYSFVAVSINDLQITASATTVCSGTSVELNINQQNNPSPNFSLFHQAGGYFADSNNDDYVVFPVSPTLNTNFSSWTMECWAKIMSPGEEGILSIGNQEQGGGNIIASGWSNTFAAGSNTDAGGSGTISSYPYNIGVWNHFALSFQSGTYRLFLNGELKESWVSGSTVVINNQYPLMTNTHWWWRGGNLSSHRMSIYYDNIRVSNVCRYTLNFVPNTNWNNDTNTIGLWDFNEGSGNSAIDKSGNQNNGIIYGATYSSDVAATTLTNISLNYSYLWSTGETTATINPSPTTTTTYWCDVTVNGATCRKEVTVTVNSTTPAPTASSQSFCTASTVAKLVATGTNMKWYAEATGGTALASSTALVTGTTYYASQTVGTCESTRANVLVTINDPQITASANAVCSGTVLTLTANSGATISETNSCIGNIGTPNPWSYPSAFDGGYISLGNFGAQTVFSISMWVNPGETQNGISIILDASHGGTSNWVIQAFGNNTYTWGNMSFDLTPNVWQHLLLTYNNGNRNCYINGQLTKTLYQVISYSGSPNLYLGNWPEGARRFNGLVDELYITNTIQQTSNFTPPSTINSAGSNCFGLWHFDEGLGSNSLNSATSQNINIGSWNWLTRSNLNTTYAWSTGETTATINPSPTTTTTYWCDVTTNGATCRKEITITVNSSTPAPMASSQSFCMASTVANLVAAGTNMKWYATATGGTTLASSTALVTGSTYYASQTIGTCESARTAVAISINDSQITASAKTICSETIVGLSILENPSTTNYSLDFPNSSQYSGNAEAFCNSNLSGFDLTGNFTIEFWIKAEQNYYWHLMGKNTFGNNSQGWLLKKPGNDLTIAWTYVPDEFSFHTFNYNTWEHVAISYNNDSNTFYYFKNGKLISSENRNININPAPYNFVIGHELGTGNWFKGKIDNLRISSVARYTEDFNPLHNFNTDNNTIAMYDFNEGFGSVASDLSGNGRNLSLFNTLYSSDTFFGSLLNNINYLWSTGETTATINPSPTTTTTYWCDVTTNGVTCRKEITITVTPKTTPTFAEVLPVCSGATISALPTTSTNAIKGTWSPELNNTTTTTYTFTPTAGQCVNTTTQTITITAPKVTSAISFVAPVTSLTSVTIGTQVWTNKNLDVTTYRDGTPIPQVTDPTAWAALTTGAWCYYNNDPANGSVYGKLYNWYAVAGIHDNDPNTPNKILAPLGWHIPSDIEWTILVTNLGGETVAGVKMKTIGTQHWLSPNVGATNDSGFSGLPGGSLYGVVFAGLGVAGQWWSSSEFSLRDAYIREVVFDDGKAYRGRPLKRYGYSVRCLRD